MPYAPIVTILTRPPYDVPVSCEVIGRVLAGPDENQWQPDLGECVVTHSVCLNANGHHRCGARVYAEGEPIILTEAEREMIQALGTQQYEAGLVREYEPEDAPIQFDRMPDYETAA